MMTVEYRVRQISRYVVTRYEGDAKAGSISTKGEYENETVAYEVAYALCKSEHDAANEPVDSADFIYPAKPVALPPDGLPSSAGSPLTSGDMAN